MALLTLAASATPGASWAQSAADNGVAASAGGRGVDLRRHFEQAAAAAGPPAASGPAWQVSTSIDVSEAFTDNAYYSNTVARNGIYSAGGKPQWDLITQITPGFNLVGDSSRIKVNLHYAPTISVYARNSSLDQISQNLDGTLHGILLPDTLFLDVRAFAATQSLAGGTGPNGQVAQDRQSLAQNYTFSASPYAQHRFGAFGLAEVGYSIAYGSNNGVTDLSGQTLTPQQQLLLSQVNRGVNSNVVTQTEHAAFTSGEDFGRFSVKPTATATQYPSGTGVYRGASSANVITDVAYAINRFVAALGRLGYEKIRYNGVPPVRISDGVWAGGARLTPNADSSLSVLYGHRYGRRNVFASGSYAATARLHLFASYSQSLTTGLEDIQNNLDQVTVDNTGALYDTQTGAPIALVNNLFGVQNSVFRLERTSLSAVLIYARDVFNLALSRESRNVVSADPILGSVASSRGTYGSVAWTHDLSPAVSTNVYLQYGRNRYASAVAATQSSIVASASITWALSPTLSTNALYSYSHNGGLISGQANSQNFVLVGLHKQF